MMSERGRFFNIIILDTQLFPLYVRGSQSRETVLKRGTLLRLTWNLLFQSVNEVLLQGSAYDK